MKYIANPVEVDAYSILEIEGVESTGESGTSFRLIIGDGQSENQLVVASPDMTARMGVKVGDYWVIQSDGYIYLNPKAVFERKYRPAAAYTTSVST